MTISIGEQVVHYPDRFKAMTREDIRLFIEQSRAWYSWTDIFNLVDQRYSETDRKAYRVSCEYIYQSDDEGGTDLYLEGMTVYDKDWVEMPLRLSEADILRFFEDVVPVLLEDLKEMQEQRTWAKIYPPFEGDISLENETCREWVVEEMRKDFVTNEVSNHVAFIYPMESSFVRDKPPEIDPRWSDMTLYYAVKPIVAGEERDTTY